MPAKYWLYSPKHAANNHPTDQDKSKFWWTDGRGNYSPTETLTCHIKEERKPDAR